ncbi:uncharacterized protein ATC70_012633 [Mucor velutinosus]|uniref:Myb-like domain-containing protein n=1 Tax=Mucor velutinosus TaxID=708070 RepID=A0AAN7HX29_9FUNG|nr:hypothetical protein ATC70_012633 [Mucor velutinosus]
MFNSSALSPNTPPTMSRTQKEQDAANSLVELQQIFSSNDNTMQPNSGINSPAKSPIEPNHPATTTSHYINPQQYPRDASATISPFSQQAPHPPGYELIMLPSIYRQRESAVRSSLSRSLPAFGSLVHKEDKELRRESAIQNDRPFPQRQAQLPSRKQLKLFQAQYRSVYQVHHSHQGPSFQSRLPHRLPQLTPAQAFAHVHAQAYYLAHARAQTFGYPQQQQHQHQQPSPINNQQQPIMNHYVRALEDRHNNQPWPESNSNKSSRPARANDPTSMQTSFSIRGNGIHIQRSTLHPDQQPTPSIPSRQHQATDRSSSQQQMAHQKQQRLAAVCSRKSNIQAAPCNLDQQGMSRSKTSLNPVTFCHPTTNITHQVYNQREAIQQQAHRQHQQAHKQAVHQVNQHFKQQHANQQHRYHLQQHQQAMHQSMESSRQTREEIAQQESLPHCQPFTQRQPQQEQRAITISPSTTSETVLTTEAEEDEDEEMYGLEEDDEEDDEYFEEGDDSDPEFQGASKLKKHSGHSSNSGSSNHHHHDSNGSSSHTRNKKGKYVKEKPRWTAEMRESLLKAVITYKNLDDMTSFHWSQIGKQVGRSGKACKDQWRRALLPKIQHTFDRCDQDFNTGTPGASSYPASLQPQQQRNNKQ